LTEADCAANMNAGMAVSTNLLQFLLMLAAGWLQRHQAAAIEYLKAENRLLRERVRSKNRDGPSGGGVTIETQHSAEPGSPLNGAMRRDCRLFGSDEPLSKPW
jgi:hypothetical protein